MANQAPVKSRPKRAAASGNPSPKVSSGKEASKLATAAPANSIPPATKLKAEAARNWTDIKVGSLVIAQESFVDGWWEAIVTEVRPDTRRSSPNASPPSMMLSLLSKPGSSAGSLPKPKPEAPPGTAGLLLDRSSRPRRPPRQRAILSGLSGRFEIAASGGTTPAPAGAAK
jgi:hypothetical protein